jgi:hypothetical protein
VTVGQRDVSCARAESIPVRSRARAPRQAFAGRYASMNRPLSMSKRMSTISPFDAIR